MASGGGLPLASISDLAGTDPSSAAFVAILVEDDGLLPAVARLTPEQAAALLLACGGEDAEPAAAEPAAALRDALTAGGAGAYLLKAGGVGGAPGERLALEVRADHVDAILAAIGTGAGEWERDPDFGYEVATSIPGIDPAESGVLVPRFHYTRTDRVYEHAALVPEVRTARRERLLRTPGLAPEILAAV